VEADWPSVAGGEATQGWARTSSSGESQLFEGILWILQSAAARHFLRDEYLSASTCWRRLKQCEEMGVWLKAWNTLLGTLDEKGMMK
jgi:transposase